MTKSEQLQITWEKRISDFKSSGLSMTKWCDQNEIKLHQLQYWLKKYNGSDSDTTISKEWITIPLDNKLSKQLVNRSLELKIGHCIINLSSGFDSELLKETIKVLMDLC